MRKANRALPDAGGDAHQVACQVTAAEREAERVSRAAKDAKGAMERAASAWETYDNCRTSLQAWLAERNVSGSTTEVHVNGWRRFHTASGISTSAESTETRHKLMCSVVGITPKKYSNS